MLPAKAALCSGVGVDGIELYLDYVEPLSAAREKEDELTGDAGRTRIFWETAIEKLPGGKEWMVQRRRREEAGEELRQLGV